MKANTSEANSIFSSIDLFICASGFESRSKSFALSIKSSNIKKGYIFHIDENYAISYENLKELQSTISCLKMVQHPKNNPIETYDIIFQKLNDFYCSSESLGKLNIVVDITTFTREVLLILFKVLHNALFLDKFNISLVYTPAESYPCEWLTRGVRYIRSIFGYSGMISPSKKLMLVILNGFENERTEEIINSFEPNAIALGRPPHEDSINYKLSDRGKINFDEIKNKYQSNVIEEFEFSCIEVEKTIIAVEKIIDKYEDEYNIVLSPLNNKISTIAIAFVALNNENIQICYASANQYNINEYSTPCDYFLYFEMNNFFKV